MRRRDRRVRSHSARLSSPMGAHALRKGDRPGAHRFVRGPGSQHESRRGPENARQQTLRCSRRPDVSRNRLGRPVPGCAAVHRRVRELANYCTNTEWLKNRNVTLGCVGTNYCPNDRRDARLDGAVHESAGGRVYARRSSNVVLLVNPAVDPRRRRPTSAQTADYPPVHYPRQAVITARFSGALLAATSTLVADR